MVWLYIQSHHAIGLGRNYPFLHGPSETESGIFLGLEYLPVERKFRKIQDPKPLRMIWMVN